MTSTRSVTRTLVHLAGVLIGCLAFLTVPSGVSAAVAPASMSAAPLTGPVGTVVTLSGNAGPGCNPSAFPTLNFSQGTTGPTEFIVVPVSSDGTWSSTFVIPPFLGALATRGGYGANVVPGTYTFQGPVCAGQTDPSTTVSYQVTGTAASQPASRFVGISPTPDGKGYWLAQSGGGVFAFGNAAYHGALPSGPGGLDLTPAAPITGIAASSDGGGYWLVGQDGGVFGFGDAGFYGSLPSIGLSPAGVVVGITSTPDGKGYWLLGADGGVFAFGDAGFYGAPLTGVAMTALAATPDGKGYLAIPANGDAPLAQGDATVPPGRKPGPMTLSALVSGGALTPSGQGVWETASDGGVFASGDAGFFGSLPGVGAHPAAPVIGMARTPDGMGYWLVGADGGVFAFGDAGFFGSAGGSGISW